MPSLTLAMSPNGPIITALVGVSFPWRMALGAAGRNVPPNLQGLFVLDTGASTTSIDFTFLQPLELAATGSLPTHTSSTAGMPIPYSIYDVSLTIPASHPGSNLLIVGKMSVTTSHYQSHGINGLIGRDVLSQCVLTYDGPNASFTLAV